MTYNSRLLVNCEIMKMFGEPSKNTQIFVTYVVLDFVFAVSNSK